MGEDAKTLSVLFAAARGERPTVESNSPAMDAAKRGVPYDRGRANL